LTFFVFQEELELIESFGQSANKAFGNPALLFIFWMANFQKGTDVSLKTAARLAKENPGKKMQSRHSYK
jgi:hypothetical protein